VAFAEADQGSPWTLVIGSGAGEGRVTPSIAAQYVASKISGGPVLAVTIPGIGVVAAEISEFQKKLPQYCPKCSVKLLPIPPAAIGTDSGTRIASYLRGSPHTKYVFLSTIDLSLGLNSALAANGIQAVPTVAQTTSSAGLDAIRDHRAGLEATTEYPSVDGAYRAIDGLARYFRGQSLEPDQDATLPQWLITAANVTSERPLPTVKDYANQFYALSINRRLANSISPGLWMTISGLTPPSWRAWTAGTANSFGCPAAQGATSHRPARAGLMHSSNVFPLRTFRLETNPRPKRSRSGLITAPNASTGREGEVEPLPVVVAQEPVVDVNARRTRLDYLRGVLQEPRDRRRVPRRFRLGEPAGDRDLKRQLLRNVPLGLKTQIGCELILPQLAFGSLPEPDRPVGGLCHHTLHPFVMAPSPA
jgi:hypothetical protein